MFRLDVSVHVRAMKLSRGTSIYSYTKHTPLPIAHVELQIYISMDKKKKNHIITLRLLLNLHVPITKKSEYLAVLHNTMC